MKPAPAKFVGNNTPPALWPCKSSACAGVTMRFVQEVLDEQLTRHPLSPPTAVWRRSWPTASCAAAALCTPCSPRS